MQSEMTLRDQFAAAALTGLLARRDCYDHEIAVLAWDMAAAMLRERCRSGGDCPLPDNAPNHDAAPAATASEATASPERVCVRSDAGTGDTQSFDAYRRFVGEVMNWISEATGFLHDDVLRTDDARDLIHNACMRCWDAFDRIAYPTVHGASPEARASVESVAPQPATRGDSDRTDKAAPRPSEGTGDTPKPISGCVSDRSKPIASEQEPVAWGVADGKGLLATSIHRIDAVDMQGDYAYRTDIVPLYRSPTLTDAEAETLRELRDEAAQYADEIGLCASEVRGRQRIIDGLLVRLGGER